MAKKKTPAASQTQTFNYLYIITWSLMPLVFFFYKDSAQDPGLFPRQALLGLSTLIGGLLLFTRKTKTLPFLITLSAITFFLLWHFAGYTQAFSKAEFWGTFSRNGLMLGYLVLTFQLLRNKLLSFSAIVYSGVLFGTISALSLVPDLLGYASGSNSFASIYSVTGLFSHKNFAASALLMALPFLYLGTRKENKVWRYIALVGLLLAIIEIAVLRTRGVWAGFLGGVGATVLLQLLSKQKDKNQLKLIGFGSVAFVVLLSIVFLTGSATEKILDTRNIDTRFFYWNHSVEMAKEHPIAGVGAGNWKINFPKYGLKGTNQSVMEGETNIVRPHNDMLWVLSEMGIPAWVALAIFQLLLLFICVKILNHTDGEKRNYAMATIFGLVAFATYGLGEFPIERPVAVGLLVLLAAEALRLAEEEQLTKKPFFMLSPVLTNVLILAFALGGFWVASKRIAGEKEAKRAVNAYLTRNPDGMLRYGDAAQNTFFEVDIYNTPMQYFKGIGYLAKQDFINAEREFLDGLNINPYHLNTMKQLGDCYKYQNKFNEALEEYDAILAISPRFYMANLNKVEIYLKQKNTEAAIQTLNLVSHEVTYPKYKQVGLGALMAFGKQKQAQRLPNLYALVKNNSSNPDKLWQAYLVWKKQVRSK